MQELWKQWGTETMWLSGIFLSVWLARWWNNLSQPKKGFGMGAESRVLVGRPMNEVDGLEIRYRGKPIKRLSEHRAYYMNCGQKEIEAEDFLIPAVVSYTVADDLYDLEIIARMPQNLPAVVTQFGNQIVLDPLHLNPGDYVVVAFKLTDFRGDLVPRARLKGVSLPSELALGRYQSWFIVWPLLQLLAGCLGSYAVIHWLLTTEPTKDWEFLSFYSLLMLVFPAVLLSNAAIQWLRTRGFRRAKVIGKETEHLRL